MSPAAGELRLVGDRFVDAAGESCPVRWACGLTAVEDLAEYEACGLNVVYLDLPARTEADWVAARQLAAAAAARGLGLIIGLNPIDSLGVERLDPADPEARRRMLAWLTDLVTEWRHRPGLLAWALQSEVEERLEWTTAGFQAELRRRYGGEPARLAEAWRRPEIAFEQVTPAGARQLDAGWPGGLGRPGLDLARWRRDEVGQLLRLWQSTVAAIDPEHPVLGGRTSRFRTLLAAPLELAGQQPCCLPSAGWGDPVWHQAGAVAVAAQAGRYAVIPCLDSAGDPVSLLRWTRLMLGRGAAGVSFSSWPQLRADPARRRAVLAFCREAEQPGWAGFRPTVGAAVVLDGLVRGPRLGDRSVHGYGDFGGDEPLGLLELLRTGTRFGPLAVLRPGDLTRVPLAGYGCLFLPATFELTEAQAVALEQYVLGGGVLVGEVGAGCLGSGDLRYLPPPLGRAFGLVINDVRLAAEVFLDERQRARLALLPPDDIAFPELAPTIAHPGSLTFRKRTLLFPGLVPEIATPPILAAALLRSPTAFFHPVDDSLRVLARQGEIGGPAGQPPAIAGLTQHPWGLGTACFISPLIWSRWLPGELTFEMVHDGLLSLAPQLTEVSRTRLTSDSLYVARSDDRLWLHRLADTPALVQLDLPVAEPRLYRDGLTVLRRALAKDEQSPVKVLRSALIARRIIDLEGGRVRLEEAPPVALWPFGVTVAADLVDYGPERVIVRIFGESTRAERPPNSRWVMAEPTPTEAALVLEDGAYRVTPGSLHRAEWVGRRPPGAPQPGLPGITRWYETLTAGLDGRLVLRREFLEAQVTLTPVKP